MTMAHPKLVYGDPRPPTLVGWLSFWAMKPACEGVRKGLASCISGGLGITIIIVPLAHFIIIHIIILIIMTIIIFSFATFHYPLMHLFCSHL